MQRRILVWTLTTFLTALVPVLAVTFASAPAPAKATEQTPVSPRKETVEGIRNFTVVDATVGCAGATEVQAIPGLKARGYKAIVNLRLATEAGAEIEASRAAAAAAGMTFIHLPFDGTSPQSSVVDAFIKAVTDKANQPVFINCGSANRVGAVWLAKRLVVDKWPEAKALEEARLIGLSSAPLQAFALDYARSRR